MVSFGRTSHPSIRVLESIWPHSSCVKWIPLAVFRISLKPFKRVLFGIVFVCFGKWTYRVTYQLSVRRCIYHKIYLLWCAGAMLQFAVWSIGFVLAKFVLRRWVIASNCWPRICVTERPFAHHQWSLTCLDFARPGTTCLIASNGDESVFALWYAPLTRILNVFSSCSLNHLT